MAKNRILKLLCLFLTLLFLLCACACGDADKTPDTDVAVTDEEKESESSALSEATSEPKKYSVRYLETEGGKITGNGTFAFSYSSKVGDYTYQICSMSISK